MSTTYVDGTTPLDAVHMNALQQKVEKNAASGYLGLDASSNAALASGQRIVWAGDTNLYRAAAGVLQSDSQFVVSNQAGLYVNNTSTAGWVLRAQIAGDTTVKFRLGADGAMSWGPGGGVGVDTNLYRVQAGVLATDGQFRASLLGFNFVGYTALVVGDTTPRWRAYADGKQEWGPGNAATDTNLYRNAAAELRTAGIFRADGDSYAQNGTAYQVRIGNSSGYASLAFGSTFDTILYRVGASTLQTDTFLKVLGAGAGVAAPNVSGLMLNFYGLGSRWIEMGATDSGGAGYKMLRIAN